MALRYGSAHLILPRTQTKSGPTFTITPRRVPQSTRDDRRCYANRFLCTQVSIVSKRRQYTASFTSFCGSVTWQEHPVKIDRFYDRGNSNENVIPSSSAVGRSITPP